MCSPVYTGGKRKCPPEDVGGIGGYYDFLEAIADPKNPEHDAMLEWVRNGEEAFTFDPKEFKPERSE